MSDDADTLLIEDGWVWAGAENCSIVVDSAVVGRNPADVVLKDVETACCSV